LEKPRKRIASRYPPAARKRTRLYPAQKAIIKADMELITEENAFVAQAHGIMLLSFDSSSRIPVGNGNPIRKPRGKITKTVRMIFKGRMSPMKFS